MVFKNFRIQVILRVILLTLFIAGFAWCLVTALYLRSVYLGVAAVFSVIELIWYVDRFNRDFRMFMLGLLQRDFTTTYQPSGKGKSFDAVYEVLNRISAAFQTISAEKETQHRYLEMLVEHIRVGVLSIDKSGKVNLANQALKDLLGIRVISDLRSFHAFDESFSRTILEIGTGETKLLKLRVGNELLQLSMHASEIRLQDHDHKLISLQNISNELDNREMEAWQKLIRVLSHEILNSVSPITSLSDTLHGLVKQQTAIPNDHDKVWLDSLDKGLEAIKLRSEGLYNFTQTYKKLTSIPKLSLKPTNISDLFNRIKLLMQPRLNELNVTLTVVPLDRIVNVDPELMEHVLINLLLNATDAVRSVDAPAIGLQATANAHGVVSISIKDNGEGMDDQVSEKIFIPFFTTRKEGSGIGLAITKQILQLHRAEIRFQTEKGRGTEFTITL